jgi:signal peptidase I
LSAPRRVLARRVVAACAATLVGASIAGVVVAFGVGPLTVEGRSMAPTLGSGDVVLTVKARALRPPIREGTIVVARRPGDGGSVVKRVVSVSGALGERWFVLRGDNARTSADSRAYGPVPERRIEGVVIARLAPSPRWLTNDRPTGDALR